MNFTTSLISFIGIICAAASIGSELKHPEIQVESYLFSDSTKIEFVMDVPGSKIMLEFGSGNDVFFREYSGPYYIKKTKTIRYKSSHPDLGDSDVKSTRVYKKSGLGIELMNEPGVLTDGKKGNFSLEDEQWQKYDLDRLEFKFKTESKKLEEVEILSLVDPDQNILPPKKVVLYAHLKNGKKVHIRTANTIGKFKGDEQFWSHTLRLNGKPKLKKILRKTLFFSLTISPHKIDGESKSMCFDEVLVR